MIRSVQMSEISLGVFVQEPLEEAKKQTPSDEKQNENVFERQHDSGLNLVTKQNGHSTVDLMTRKSSSTSISSEANASLFSSTMNLTNTIMGVGILGLPLALASNGYVLGVFFLVVFALLSLFGLHLLAMVSNELFGETRDATFYKVSSHIFKHGAVLGDMLVILQAYGVGSSYLIIIGDLLPDALVGIGMQEINRRIAITVCFLVFVVPLCCFRQINALRHVSTISNLFVLFLSFVVLSFAIDTSQACDRSACGPTQAVRSGIAGAKTLPVFIFGFGCHENLFPVCNELQRFTTKRIDTVISSSILLALAVYILVAVSGYATFGSEVSRNILESYPQTPLVTIGRLFASMIAVLGFPLQCYPFRHSLLQILTVALGKVPPTSTSGRVRFWLATLGFSLATWGLAMGVSDLGVVLGVIGATTGATISYILPGYAYYTLDFKNPIRLSSLRSPCTVRLRLLGRPVSTVGDFYLRLLIQKSSEASSTGQSRDTDPVYCSSRVLKAF
ncbi:hypothetical protein AAMO2058_001313900 [Amorphochlora amoebiformis]